MVDASVASTVSRRMTVRGPEGWRRVAILTGSAALHIGVLAVVGMGLLTTRLAPLPVDDMPLYIQMEPRPLLKGETVRVPAPSRVRTAETQPLTRARSPLIAPRQKQDQDAPSPPTPRVAAGVTGSGTPAPPADANPWTYRPETQAAAVGRSLRTGISGCRVMDGRLSPGEQALCDDRFNAGAAEAAARHPLGARTQTASEQRRDAEFAREGAAALRRYEALRAPLTGGVGVLGSGECPGGNLGIGCAGANLDPSMREGAQNLIRSPSARQGHLPLPGHHD